MANILIFGVAEMWRRKQGLSPSLPKPQSVVTVLLKSQSVGIYSVLAIVFQACFGSGWILHNLQWLWREATIDKLRDSLTYPVRCSLPGT